MHFVYILECVDGTYYTGWTTDPVKRIQTHNRRKGAKYTRNRIPVKLIYLESYLNKSSALKREYQIKQMSRKDKIHLIHQSEMKGVHKMNFQLKEWRMEDAAILAKQANNPHIAQFLRDAFPYPYTLKDAENYITSCIKMPLQEGLVKAIMINGIPCGSIGLFVQGDVARKSAELGYWLGESYWNQGIMSKAVLKICQEGFEKLDIVRIYAEPFSLNTASQKVLIHNGFQKEGVLKKSIYKQGTYQDSIIYALLKD